MRTKKAEISLYIRTGWFRPSLSTLCENPFLVFEAQIIPLFTDILNSLKTGDNDKVLVWLKLIIS